jgi:hypothetical protein
MPSRILFARLRRMSTLSLGAAAICLLVAMDAAVSPARAVVCNNGGAGSNPAGNDDGHSGATACGQGADAGGSSNPINTAIGFSANANGANSSNVAVGDSTNASGTGSANAAFGVLSNASGAGSNNIAAGESAPQTATPAPMLPSAYSPTRPATAAATSQEDRERMPAAFPAPTYRSAPIPTTGGSSVNIANGLNANASDDGAQLH